MTSDLHATPVTWESLFSQKTFYVKSVLILEVKILEVTGRRYQESNLNHL